MPNESIQLRVLICGAGIAGLGAAIAIAQKGHEVIVIERASKLSEIGAGIQIPPNSSRVLASWGVIDAVREQAGRPNNILTKRYKDGKLLGTAPLHPSNVERYGHSYLLIHRADYQRLLYDHAEKLGVEFQFGAGVANVDTQNRQITLSDGRKLSGDVIVGADGIKSSVRPLVVPEEVNPSMTTNCAYRATVSREDILSDPKTAHFLQDEFDAICWIGPGQHAMTYPIKKGEMFNLVLSHPNKATIGVWNEPGDLEHMRATYSHFDPALQRVLAKVKGCLKWVLADIPPISRWVADDSPVVLIGDAAHAMVPYLAQGASMGIEDAASLSEALDGITSRSEILPRLRLFEQIRKPRAERIQVLSRLSGTEWHLPDGPGQEARDRRLAGEPLEDDKAKLWTDPEVQSWLFGYDVISETRNLVAKEHSVLGNHPVGKESFVASSAAATHERFLTDKTAL